MRAFLALEVPGFDPTVAWPRAPERHLTLRFFGELAEERVPAIQESMTATAARIGPFELEFRGGGAFPDLDRPRVAWIGVGEGAVAVQALAAALGEELGHRGFAVEPRPFVPHVTAMRIRNGSEARRAKELLASLGTRTLASTRVDRLLLFESRLHAGGAEHIRRAEVPLVGPGPRSAPAGAS